MLQKQRYFFILSRHVGMTATSGGRACVSHVGVVCMQIAMVTDSRTLHHYWSHTDVTPWSADGTLMLSQRADVAGVQSMLEGAQPSLQLQLGYTNFTEGLSVIVIAALVQPVTGNVACAHQCTLSCFALLWVNLLPLLVECCYCVAWSWSDLDWARMTTVTYCYGKVLQETL